MTTNEARTFLKSHIGIDFHKYIYGDLASDFAIALAEEFKQQVSGFSIIYYKKEVGGL